MDWVNLFEAFSVEEIGNFMPGKGFGVEIIKRFPNQEEWYVCFQLGGDVPNAYRYSNLGHPTMTNLHATVAATAAYALKQQGI